MKKIFAFVSVILSLFLLSCGWGRKADEKAVIKTVQSIFSGADARDWGKIERAMADRVLFDYTSLAGGNPATLTPEEITAAWKKLLPGFYSTHHRTGEFKVAVNDNEATADFHGLALHYLPVKKGGDIWVVSGTYSYHLVKKDDGRWVVDGMKFNLLKQSGNTGLPADAARNAAAPAPTGRAEVREEARETVEEFFISLERLDINRFMKIWSDDAAQLMPLAPADFPSLLRGKDAIYRQYKGLPENFTSMKFQREIFPTVEPGKVIVSYEGIIPLKKGGSYNNIYIGVFEVEEGKIKNFTEYFDPVILEKGFGKKDAGSEKAADGDTGLERVEFTSKGSGIVGNLHTPPSFSRGKKYSGVVVTGSWTTVKEQMPDHYAKKMAARGFVALTFDFRNYGQSDGRVRDHEVPGMKAEDITSAVEYLSSLPYIDKTDVGGLAVCASAGYMSQAILSGAAIGRAVFVAPWLHNAKIAGEIYGGSEAVGALKMKSDAAMKKFRETGVVDYVPAASDSDKRAAMYGPFDYYLNSGRGAIPRWGNRFAVMAWRGWLEYDPVSLASKIRTPILIIHSKTAAIPEGAEQFYRNLAGEKEIIWVKGPNQFDFYDNEKYTGDASDKAAKWLTKK
jgi:fermentation-respiration switch protein FrsA (DUF1100 family)/ketosteroid isomerase-like protein